jgi:hypothetical protein
MGGKSKWGSEKLWHIPKKERGLTREYQRRKIKPKLRLFLIVK